MNGLFHFPSHGLRKVLGIRAAAIGILCGILFAGTACQPAETRVEFGYRKGIFYSANGKEPSNLDPHTVTGLPEFNVVEALFEGLVTLDTDTLLPIPAGATHWEISEDFTTFRFFLHPEGRWSNGDPVTAEDYLFSYQRVLSPGLGAQYASELYDLKGAREYNQGNLKDFSEVGVRVVTPNVLELELSAPMTPQLFLGKMAHGTWFPVHPPTILAHGQMDQRDTRWTRPGNLVSNGLFVLKDWNVNSHISVEKNRNHRRFDKVHLNEIVFIATVNNQTTERLFRTGMVHQTNNLIPSRIDYYREEQPESLQTDPSFGIYYILSNTKVPPLSNPKFRRALSLSINREALVEHITRMGQLPAYGFVPPGIEGWSKAGWFEYDPDLARELLAELDLDLQQVGQQLTYLFNMSENNTAIAEAVTQMWREELGITIGTINREWAVYLEERRMRNFKIMRASWIGDYPDPLTFLGLWISDGTHNVSGWNNSEYDELLRRSDQTFDSAERMALLKKAEGILLKEMPIIPLYFLNNTYLLDPNVEGWAASLLDRRKWDRVRFVSRGEAE